MRVALFVPCYIDQFYPDVAIATLELLERFGCDVHYPSGQTCCGQPMANTGCSAQTEPVAHRSCNCSLTTIMWFVRRVLAPP